jgi:hypothetical protein
VEQYRLPTVVLKNKTPQIGDNALPQRGFSLSTPSGAEQKGPTPSNTRNRRQRESRRRATHKPRSEHTRARRHSIVRHRSSNQEKKAKSTLSVTHRASTTSRTHGRPANSVPLSSCKEGNLTSSFRSKSRDPRYMPPGFSLETSLILKCCSFLAGKVKGMFLRLEIRLNFLRLCPLHFLGGNQILSACRGLMAHTQAQCFSLLQLVLLAFLLLTSVSTAYSIAKCGQGCTKNRRGDFVCRKGGKVFRCTPTRQEARRSMM